MADTENLWLIKSSGRVMGPVPAGKVAELLRAREISVLDEISSPMRRWQTLQFHPEFKELIDSLRKTSLHERTEVTWTPASQTSVTQTLTDLSDGELTEEISGDLSGFTNTAKEIVVENVKEQPTGPAPAPTAGRFQTSAAQNTAIQKQVEKTTRGLWIVTAIVLIAVAVFVLQRKVSQGEFEMKPSVQNMKQSVVGSIQIGRYAEALKELKSYYPDPMQSGEMAIYFGSLLIQLENQTVLGRRLLNQVLASKRPEIKQAYTGLGIADLIDGNLDSAQTHFQKALELDSVYVPALLNMAIVHLQRGEYVRAKADASRALDINPQQGEAVLTLAEAQLYLFKANGGAAELGEANATIKKFLSRNWDFTPEIGFYSLYFEFLRREKGLMESVAKYLDRDPQLTLDHRHNVFIYRGRSQWNVLARLCEQMTDKMGDDSRVSTLLAACFAQEARWENSRQAIEKAVNQAPKDPLNQAWYSFVLKASGDPAQASVILGRAGEYNRRGDFVLPAVLQARFCEQNGDIACARDTWQRVFERDLDYLPAIAGLAWVHAQNKAYGEATKQIDKGLRISPDYIPLLMLRQRAEREGWHAAN